MSTTEFQPSLPPEIVPSEAELNFADLSPAGLFPQNQDSNFGFFIRKIWCDRIQEIADQQTTMYNERFPDTSLQFLDDQERQYGLPVAPSTLTLAQRRQQVLNRIRVGPFTRTRRREIVESFIASTFGIPVQFGPGGVALSSAGLPLYGESSEVSTLYKIRENLPIGKNLILDPSVEAGITEWGGTSVTMGWYPPTNPMFGVRAIDAACTIAGLCWINKISPVPVTAGKAYSFSVWLQRLIGARQVSLWISWYDASLAYISQSTGGNVLPPLSQSSWTQVKLENAVAPVGATQSIMYVVFGNGAVNDEYFVDGIQLEESAVATDFVDPTQSAFSYEVRIKNTVTPDDVGLHRELDRITPAHMTYSVAYVVTP